MKIPRKIKRFWEEITIELGLEVKVGIHQRITGKGSMQKNGNLKVITFERLGNLM